MTAGMCPISSTLFSFTWIISADLEVGSLDQLLIVLQSLGLKMCNYPSIDARHLGKDGSSGPEKGLVRGHRLGRHRAWPGV